MELLQNQSTGYNCSDIVKLYIICNGFTISKSKIVPKMNKNAVIYILSL